ncbi:glycogen synthase [Lentzea sp.]|uniref:glycogen synthase n=1 Tax=Lentzea sp. TaxID=56099 RepID=UPI002C5DD138|nr:glycogen synthase [Lentzea sp.]HUQ55157.1 glycogen synthase [Lentzea sp.]
MRIGLLTREYPPEVYGGGGAHVGNLVPRLRDLIDVDVHGYGDLVTDDPAHVHRHQWPAAVADANMALRALSVNAHMAARLGGVDLVHSHTWYTNLAGHLTKIMYNVPHVITAHSLEARRPWKAEQLDSGYGVSSWMEDTAYRGADAVIAVSEWMRGDVLECNPHLDPERVFVVRNGIDTEQFHPTEEREALVRYGIHQDRPLVLFVGRVSRQKGILPLLSAARRFNRDAQLVLCAGAPDTPGLSDEVAAAIDELRTMFDRVLWIPDLHDATVLRQLYAAATVFVCPSVYEPMGIVNLEAMACGTAVVAAEVGGIPEVVVPGETGVLVPYPQKNYAGALADSVNAVLDDPAWAAELGRAGRKRVEELFSWTDVARRTVDVYRGVLNGDGR